MCIYGLAIVLPEVLCTKSSSEGLKKKLVIFYYENFFFVELTLNDKKIPLFSRFFFFFYDLACFNKISAQGSLVTFLSTPMHYPDINTFKDLEQSDLPIRTSSISFKEILVGDPNLKSLAYRLEKWAKEEDIHSSDGRFAGFQRVNVFNLEHFKDVLYVSQKNDTRVLHTMNECLISYFISYVVNRCCSRDTLIQYIRDI